MSGDRHERNPQAHWSVCLMVAATMCGLPGIFGAAEVAAATEPLVMSLDECLQTAMERNHARPASRHALAAAEAQHRQAMSAYWPHVTLRGAYEIMDEPPNYIFPSSTFAVPGMTFETPPMFVTIPADAFGPGFPPQDVQLPVPGQSFDVPGQSLTVPDQEIKLQDRDSWYASLNAQWLLFDGGMRSGMRQQSRAGVQVAREKLRRTEIAIMHDVTRLYWGAVMAGQVLRVGEDALARMEATLQLTETMYKEGSGRVKKTDYLDNKVMVENMRSAVAQLENNQNLAEMALAYTVGLDWDQSIRPVATEVPFAPMAIDLPALAAEAYAFNPDWLTLEAALSAAEGATREAKSGYFPKIALSGDLYRWWNDYDKGMATEQNKSGWTVRLGVELPLFRGFLTRNRVREASARMHELQDRQVLLREGVGVQVRAIFLNLDAAAKRHDATRDAMTAAVENRDLNTRAYQNDLVETEDVIKAQLMAALMSAQHYKIRYEYTELRSQLNVAVGKEIEKWLSAAPVR